MSRARATGTRALAVPGDLATRLSDSAYARLLGYPDGRLPKGRVRELATAARGWFARRARPWAVARTLEIARLGGQRVRLAGGPTLTSRRLADRLRAAGARRLVLAMVSAGPEVDLEVARRWRRELVDEAYFLDRFGAGVAIDLGAWCGRSLRESAAGERLGLTPGYSPGYDGWPLADQPALAALLAGAAPAGLRVHASGMLEPRSSLLAVFGLTERRADAEREWRRHPCSWCSLAGCGLRGTAPRFAENAS